MKIPFRNTILSLASSALGLCACGDPGETARVEVPVVTDTGALGPVDTDLGYRVELTEARIVIEDVQFAIAGEAHVAAARPAHWLERISGVIVPTAHAHPGHFQGGDVTGELPGRFVLSWSVARQPQVASGETLYRETCADCHGQDAKGGEGPAIGGHPAIANSVLNGVGAMPAVDLSIEEVADVQAFLSTRLGTATLLAGRYTSANFKFSRAVAGDDLADDDGLLGHTALLAGTASNEAGEVAFEARIDAPEGRELVGVPFELEVDADSTETLGLRLETRDALEGDSLFDGIDFGELIRDGDGPARLVPPSDGSADRAANDEAYNHLRRKLLTHDHFEIRAQRR